jgi:F-type H+-transporting ATPase subunit a
MDISEAAEHVKDLGHFHFPFGKHLDLPVFFVFGHKVQVTEYMVLELAVAVALIVIFVPLARRTAGGRPVPGRWANVFEAMLVFLRDEVARPAIGRHDADRFLPFIWTIFFFVLFCNLAGAIPWSGSPTGALAVTGVLAGMTFLTVVVSGMIKFGPVGFWWGMAPHLDLHWAMAIPLKLMLMFLEAIGLVIRHAVLAVRLLANMFAGHMVFAVVVSFIVATAGGLFVLWVGVTLGSLAAAAAVSLLEIFVAFLQAYIFAFLSALFIGMAVHQH